MILETLFILLPLVGAFLSPIGSVISKRFGRYLSTVIFLGGAILGSLLLPEIMEHAKNLPMGGWEAPFGINLYFSPLSVGAGIVIYFLAFLINLNLLHKDRPAGYYLLLQLYIFANLILVLTGDLFNLFVMQEIAAISLLALTAYEKRAISSKGGIKFLIGAGVVSMLFLLGIGIIYSITGTLNLAHIAANAPINAALAFFIAVLLFSALFFEGELVPFNNWVPDVYQGAASSFGATIAGVGGLSALLVLGRIWITVMQNGASFSYAVPKLRSLLMIIGILSVLIGSLAALKEGNIKRLLGFSSVAQMGLVLLGFTVGHVAGVYAALFILLSHSVVKPMLFLIAGFFIESTGTQDWKKMQGVGRRYPFLAAFFVVGALSLLGMPLFMGFWGKLELLKALTGGPGLYLIALFAILLGVILEGVYLLRMTHHFFVEAEPTVELKKPKGRKLLLFSTCLLAGIVILLGIYPKGVERIIERIVGDLLDTPTYLQIILTKGGIL